jgi:uncharacterized protein (DUF1501 family)
MLLSRRTFLKAGAVSMTALLLPRTRAARAQSATSGPVLVALYLRGGADGIQLVVPAGDPFYYSSRPTIQVPPGSELSLDGFFGLNPALAPLLPLYQSGALAILHACGSPDPSRSHFDCQDFMERAAPGNKSILDGWLNRYLTVAGGGAALAGISLRNSKAKSMVGSAPTLAFESIAGFALTGEAVPERRAALQSRYQLVRGSLLGDAVFDALAAVDVVGAVPTATSVVYPNGDLGPVLRDAAALVKADIGVKVLAIDLGGWDHHTDILARSENLGGQLAASLAAFYQDLGPRATTTLTLAMTEFGRRVSENGGGGADHGRGSAMFAVGGGIAGGRVILKNGQWPGLAPANLDMGQDLAVTTDFRNIFAEALNRHLLLSTSKLGPIFPGFSVSASEFPGLYA